MIGMARPTRPPRQGGYIMEDVPESVVSYTAPKGDSEFEDMSYDGFLDGVIMRGGLGQLVDGLLGSEDFLDELPVGGRMTSLYNNSATRYWDFLFIDLADPRTNEWPLIRSPVPGLTIMGAYLYFVLSWGPRYMAHRKPYTLTNILIAYNFLQVLASIWLFWEALDGAWWNKYSWKCEPVDYSWTPDSLRVARGFYIYFLAKLTELLDTVFFVLRKKSKQITFLHMYHHTVMPLISWGATKYYPGGHGSFIGMINSFVHIIMYTYYMLSACGPHFQPYLWWKKYITTLQLAQFCLAFLHSFQLLIYDCDYPRISLVFVLPNAIFFYYLFSDFYQRAYPDSQKRLNNQQEKEKKVKKEE